ncbi:MAG: DPP IV N-terminal domain-containing protein [Candidatus Babeliales bacterium]
MQLNCYMLMLTALFFKFLYGVQSNNLLEQPALRNIRQVTFPSMGFEKAGESYFSPDGKILLFQAVPKGKTGYQIYSIDINKKKPRLISTGKGACTCAFFRPDGKKIIFASNHEAPDDFENEQKISGYQREGKKYLWEFTPYMNIYEANPDSSDLKALTYGPAYKAECAYSRDGSHIVFASNISGNMNLYIMRSDGSNIHQVTFTDTGYNGGPFFSPDNSKILFRADYEKKHYLQIYSIDYKNGNIEQLTNNGAINWAPFWHPNGKVIVFTTSLHGHHQYELYLLNIETNSTHRLTYNASFDGLASFNKEGTQITWTSKRGSDQTCQIFIADFEMPEKLCIS